MLKTDTSDSCSNTAIFSAFQVGRFRNVHLSCTDLELYALSELICNLVVPTSLLFLS